MASFGLGNAVLCLHLFSRRNIHNSLAHKEIGSAFYRLYEAHAVDCSHQRDLNERLFHTSHPDQTITPSPSLGGRVLPDEDEAHLTALTVAWENRDGDDE